MQGTIKKLSEKGFGFITLPDRPKDLFFHAQNVVGTPFRDLREGDAVEIEGIEPTDRGDQAYGVKLLEN